MDSLPLENDTGYLKIMWKLPYIIYIIYFNTTVKVRFQVKFKREIIVKLNWKQAETIKFR